MRLLKINRNDGTGKVDTIGTYGLSVAVQDGLDKINLRFMSAGNVTLNIEIEYTNTNQAYPQQMLEFFNNVLIELSSGNNSSPILEVTPPLPIDAISVTG